jgi:hypothetical protein
MRTDGQDFLQKLVASSPSGFDTRLASISTQVGLDIALNGLGGCEGEIKPEREINRVRLESVFMAARDKYYASAGWKALPKSLRAPIQRIFLNVFVEEENLAW